MDADLQQLAENLVFKLSRRGLTLATAESCTGGLIAATLIGVPGVSSVFRCGWVTYCNQAKQEQLGVPAATITAHTAISEPVVAAMAEGALARAHADIAVAISGNAGPTSGEGEPPVGTVCIGIALRNAPTHTETLYRPGLERNDFRRTIAAYVLSALLVFCDSGCQGSLISQA